MGTLYLVGTPIGNLEDVSARALRILKEVPLIAAEDTRRARKLLGRYGIVTPQLSYYEHNKLARLDRLLAELDEGSVALISEAGMPGISDPGYELVRAALDAGHSVVPIPGPSATLAALAISGLPTDRFLYVGFLPRRRSERRRLLQSVASEPGTLLAFESPHRLLSALEDILSVLGERPLALCRELTKLHEEVLRGTTLTVLEQHRDRAPRGEYTLVIGGAGKAVREQHWDSVRVETALDSLISDGIPRAAAAKAVAKLADWRRREVYDLPTRGGGRVAEAKQERKLLGFDKESEPEYTDRR
ncbi:MAG TPA: 16S rRNA (cytidine(1402)-2'-O)-methyltransferase [Anaerolineae bacterium]|jgi:16S rRNA (cytidine1402-2'-O)-methyltransferase|nr:16S rRNA (cytidine(1402)-2'-O)-methyltransferase [Anaerolineae bacterium]